MPSWKNIGRIDRSQVHNIVRASQSTANQLNVTERVGQGGPETHTKFDSNIIMDGSFAYINFGEVDVSNGYGFRNNDGIMEVRDGDYPNEWEPIGPGGVGPDQKNWKLSDDDRYLFYQPSSVIIGVDGNDPVVSGLIPDADKDYTLGISGNAIISSGDGTSSSPSTNVFTYFNFGEGTGSDGVGLRQTSGKMQFKDNLLPLIWRDISQATIPQSTKWDILPIPANPSFSYMYPKHGPPLKIVLGALTPENGSEADLQVIKLPATSGSNGEAYIMGDISGLQHLTIALDASFHQNVFVGNDLSVNGDISCNALRVGISSNSGITINSDSDPSNNTINFTDPNIGITFNPAAALGVGEMQFRDGTTNGVWQHFGGGNGQQGWTTGGGSTPTRVWTDLNVGIGIDAPTELFEVNGNAKFDSSVHIYSGSDPNYWSVDNDGIGNGNNLAFTPSSSDDQRFQIHNHPGGSPKFDFYPNTSTPLAIFDGNLRVNEDISCNAITCTDDLFFNHVEQNNWSIGLDGGTESRLAIIGEPALGGGVEVRSGIHHSKFSWMKLLPGGDTAAHIEFDTGAIHAGENQLPSLGSIMTTDGISINYGTNPDTNTINFTDTDIGLRYNNLQMEFANADKAWKPIGTTPPPAGHVPIGTIIMYGGTAVPDSTWLFCDGTSYPIATYTELHAIIAYTYGGSGLNFNVPDTSSRFPRGASDKLLPLPHPPTGGSDTATLTTDNMPSHTHTGPSHTHDAAGLSGPSHHHSVPETGSTDIGNLDIQVYGVGPDGSDTPSAPYSSCNDGDTPARVAMQTFQTFSHYLACNYVNNDITGGAHTHAVSDTNDSGTGSVTGVTASGGTNDTGSTGSGTSFPITNPYLNFNFLIKAKTI